MLLIRHCRRISVVQRSRQLSTKAAVQEYTDTPQYPEILDLSFEAKRYRKKEVLAKKIQALNTVEEKLMALNMKKYYGFKCVMLNDHRFPYNSLPLVQYATRTVLNETGDQLPAFYRKNDAAVDKSCAEIKLLLEESLLYELECFKQSRDLKNEEITERQRANIMSSSLVQQVHRVIRNSLAGEVSHLQDIEVDVDPKHEGFWFVGGIEPLTVVQQSRDGCEWQKKHKTDPIDRPFQYLGNPYLAVRHKHPLEPVAPVLENGNFEIPTYKLDPRTLGFSTAYRHGSNAPGIWPGHQDEFGLLAYQRRASFVDRNPSYGAVDHQEALHAQGISSLFGWLLGQACYQGFTPYNDVTYPLCSQSVTTDGQFWSFYVYQLNTIVLHSHFAEESARANECWGTAELKLYEELHDGKLVGFNDQVLKNLLHFYVNVPKERAGMNMKPYLNPEERYVNEIKHDEKREWLATHYRHLITNKPRHNLVYEIYNWEKIYMVDHNTRPLMARRRPFQLNQNPFMKHLDHHTPKYVPKPIRPDGPKSKKKRENTYYPQVY